MSDFFDKITNGFNKGVAVVSTNSKAVVEKAKINTAIKNLDNERNQILQALGNKIYTAYLNGVKEISVADIESVCNDITLRTQQIQEQNNKIIEIDKQVEAVKGTQNVGITCSCGQPNKIDAKFCSKCGKQLM